MQQDSKSSSPNTILESNIFVKELLSGIMNRHFYDNIKLTIANFLSGFGVYKDLQVSRITINFNNKIYALGLLVIIGTIIFSKNARYVLVLLSTVHLGNVAACATHHPESRYIAFTEMFMCMATILALMVVLRMLIIGFSKFYLSKKNATIYSA